MITLSTFTRIQLTYFLPSAVLVLLASVFLTQSLLNSRLNSLIKQEHEDVFTVKVTVNESRALVLRDIHYLAESELLKKVINGSNRPNLEQIAALDALASDWKVLMATSMVYDQIRWLDANGQERIRLNYNAGQPQRVAEIELQNKANRYYFSNAIQLDFTQNQVYLSPFDLNVENNKVEIPYKPMIRVAHPVIDAQGVNQGVVVLNYLGESIFTMLRQQVNKELENLWLTNAQGFWLLANKSEDEWGFMFNRSDLSMAHRYPDAWQTISQQDAGQFETLDGLWIFDTIPISLYPMASSTENQNTRFWKVIRFTPKSQLNALSNPILSVAVFMTLFVLSLLYAGTLFLARSREGEKKLLSALKVSNQSLKEKTALLVEDIYEKELAQHQLKQSYDRYAGVLAGSVDGFLLMDKEGVILESNEAFNRLLRSQNTNIKGTLVSRLFAGKQSVDLADSVSTIFDENHCRMEMWCLDEDGQKRYVEISLTAIHQTQQMCAFLKDITELKKTEFELMMAASVFTHANEGIILTNDEFLILDVNQQFEMITGYRRDETIGKTPHFLRSDRHSSEFYEEMRQSLSNKGHWSGEVWYRCKTGELFLAFLNVTEVPHPYDDCTHYVGMFTDITLEKQYQKRLEHTAHYDSLTNLPNRLLLTDRMIQSLAGANRSKSFIAVIFMDLDGFKVINDTLGHDVGDQLLVNVSKNMKKIVREADTVARLGGDEFVLVLNGLQQIDDAKPVLDKLLKAIATPIQHGDTSISIGASMGVSFYPQAESIDAEQLIRQADQAMYVAKQNGKNCYHIFDLKEDINVRDFKLRLTCIEQAITNDEFTLHFQPKVGLRTEEVVGLEALIRWNHPEKGLLYPGEFLACVEQDPLAIKLSEWVIHHALQQIEIWQAQGIYQPVSINIGTVELQNPGFLDWLLGLLAEHPTVDPSMLEIEVLETSALADVLRVSELIEACRTHGIAFSLDDFGTGFASLSYLKRLPLETIKIDQSFVRNMFEDPEDIPILEGMIGLAKSLRRKVIAEGIETESHGQTLISLGCLYGQGYFIARPMPAEEVPGWIKQWRLPEAWRTQVSYAEEMSDPSTRL